MHFLYFTYDLAAIGGKKERKKKHPASLRKLANVSPAIKKTVGTIELVKKFAGSTRSNSYFFTTTFFFLTLLLTFHARSMRFFSLFIFIFFFLRAALPLFVVKLCNNHVKVQERREPV